MSKIFPILPVLESLIANCPRQVKSTLSETVFVCVQHILSTTGSLFESLIELGADPANIFILGKCYSTNIDVLRKIRGLGIHVSGGNTPLKYGTFSITIEKDIQKLWEKVREENQNSSYRRMIVIDDGGKCLNSMPVWIREDGWAVVGIEQTTSGLKPERLFEYLLIEVASSAAKRQIESPMIAEAVSKRICHAARSINATKYGVVGYGNIGKAVSTALSQQGYQVSVYDRRSVLIPDVPAGISEKSSPRALIEDAQFILGCAGEDIIPNPDKTFKDMQGQKILASCSSSDCEFNRLLTLEQQSLINKTGALPGNSLQDLDLQYPPTKLEIKLLRGGFPVNFDNSPESVPAVDIQLTRGLLLGAVIQGSLYFEDCDSRNPEKNSSNRKMLDPFIQQAIVNVWHDQTSYRSDLVKNFGDIEWIERKSGGNRSNSQLLEACYSRQYSSVLAALI